jgi:hypothetical protein
LQEESLTSIDNQSQGATDFATTLLRNNDFPNLEFNIFICTDKNKMTLRILYILAIVQITAFGQTPLEKTKDLLTKFSASFPMEKIYVHTDKPHYVSGDTVWLKAYVVNAVNHQPDSASGVVYLDLINQQSKKVVVHKLLQAISGKSSGRIVLSDEYPPGKYQLRAYTSWMVNFSQELFFQTPLEIFSSAGHPDRTPADNDIKLAFVDFFPEGGNIIEGLQNRVAFKATNSNGNGLDVQGVVVSDLGDTVATVKSQHLGLGYFNLKPLTGRDYFFVDVKSRLKTALPSALQRGYTMMVDNLNKTAVKIYVSHNFESVDKSILIAHQRGRVIYAAQTGSEKNAAGFVIPKSALEDDGIIHLTLFDSNGKPQCERLIYRNTNRSLNVNVTTNAVSHKKREKVQVDVLVTDHENKPVKGNFSVVVTDAGQLLKDPQAENIETYLLLSSDVKQQFEKEVRGIIESPAYYFDYKNPNAEIHLDLLLMTQGWRRFKWKELLAEKNPVLNHRIESGITVSGKVLQPNGAPSKKPIDIMLLFPGGAVGTHSDDLGGFVVHDLELGDSARVLVQGTKSNGGKNVIAKFDPPAIVPVDYLAPFNEKVIDNISLWIKQQEDRVRLEKALRLQKVQTLKEVEIVGHRIENDPRRSFYSRNALTIAVDHRLCSGVSSFVQLIQGRVPSLDVRGMGRNIQIFIRSKPVGFLVDGFLAFDVNTLLTIAPCDIEAIDVSTMPSPMVPGSAGGIISILTRRGNPNYDWTEEAAKGVNVGIVSGFDFPREFFSPNYETTSSDQPQIPDFRSTLFWRATVNTNAEGKASFIFYSNDSDTEYNVNLEGLSDGGKPFVFNKQF